MDENHSYSMGDSRWYDYRMVCHIHTNYSSDSQASVEQIIEAVENDDIDVMMITDHNTRGAQNEAGWYGNQLVLVEQEISPQRQNHCLAIGVDSALRPDSPEAMLQNIRRHNGDAYLAHPHSEGNQAAGSQPIPWTDWTLTTFNGLEIVNFLTDAVRGLALWQLLWYRLFPRRRVIRPNPRTIERWDQLCQHQQVTAIGSVDAHLDYIRLGPMRIPALPLSIFFQSVYTHILLPRPLDSGNLPSSRDQIREALRRGHCYVMLNPPDLKQKGGFKYWLEAGRSERGPWIMGDSLRYQPNLSVHTAFPLLSRWRLIKNGNPIARGRGHAMHYTLNTPGVYRIEASHRREVPWIYSNPIYIRP